MQSCGCTFELMQPCDHTFKMTQPCGYALNCSTITELWNAHLVPDSHGVRKETKC